MKLNKKSENENAKESESGRRLRDSGILSDLFHLGSMNNLKSKLNNATATLKNSLSVFNLKSSKEEDIADDRDDESSSSSCKNKSSAVLKFELTSLDGVSKEICANEEISKSTSPASTASSTAKSNYLIKMSASATNSLLIPTSLLNNNNNTNEVIFQNNHNNKIKNSDLLLSAKSPSSSQISQNNYFLEMNEANMKNDSKLSSNLLNMNNNNANNKLKADFYNSKLLLFSSNMNNDSYFKNGKLNDARANINNNKNKNDEEKENDQDNYDKINEINDCKANTDDDDDEDEYYNDDDDGVFVEAKTTKSSINSNRNKKIMIDEPVVNKNKPLSLINSNASCNNKNKNNSNQDENKEEEKENCNNSILASFNNSLKNYDLLKASIFKNNSQQQQQKEQSKNFDIVVAPNRSNMILESSSSKDTYENESYLNTNTNPIKSKTKPINIANNSNYEFVNTTTHSNNSFLASLLKRRSSLTSSSSTSTSSTSSVDNTNSCSSSSATSFQSKFNSFKNAASKLDETSLGKDQIVNENYNNLSLRRTTTFHSTTLNKDKKTSNKFDLLRSNNELGSMANLIEEKLIERRNKYLIENNKFFTGIPRPKVNYLDQNLNSQNKPLINSSSDVVKIKTYGSFVNSTAATKPGYIKNKINSNTLHTSASFSLNKQQQQQHSAVNNSVSSYSAASSLLYSNKLPSSKTTSSFYHRQQHVNNENLSHSDKNSFRPIKTYENYSTNAIPNRTQLQQQQYELNALTSSMKAKNR